METCKIDDQERVGTDLGLLLADKSTKTLRRWRDTLLYPVHPLCIWGLHYNDTALLGIIETLIKSLTMWVGLWHAARKIVPRNERTP